MSLGVLVTGCVHTCQHAALLWVCVRLNVSMSLHLRVGVSRPGSVCLVCQPVCLLVEVWVGKSLCVSEPWGRRAEQLQVATGKSKQVRIGGCEVGRGCTKAGESREGQSRGGAGGQEEEDTEVTQVRVLLVSPPALTGPDCLLNPAPVAGSELTLHRRQWPEGKRRGARGSRGRSGWRDGGEGQTPGAPFQTFLRAPSQLLQS